MVSTVLFYAGSEDDKAFCSYAESLDLQLLPSRIDFLTTCGSHPKRNDPKLGSAYLSFLPIHELHPYGEPPVKIADAADPLIFLLRSYYDPPYLIAGQIRWNTDNKEMAKQTKPYFSKLRRRIQKNWLKEGPMTYIGPHALRLMEQGAERTSFPPGVEIEQIEIGGKD